jgi:hypothetical protein
MIDFSNLIITGALVSLLTQGIKFLQKKYTQLGEWFTIIVALGLSVTVATFYYTTQNSAFWETLGNIFLFAGGIYAYLLERFKK